MHSWAKLALFCLVLPMFFSMSGQISAQAEVKYLANIELHTIDELSDVLDRTEALYDKGALAQDTPVALVLHGFEARAFLRQDYEQNKPVVNLAARLSALGAVDIQVCQIWMGSEGLDAAQLQPFVGLVPNGPSEIQRLVKQEKYIYF
jgi:intracellular sulfur oxidation DsrE/DsrF family protein